MYILIKVFCFSLLLNNYEAGKTSSEPFGIFTFNAMSLGHSGILITWKPNPNDTYIQRFNLTDMKFNFTVYSVVEKQNMSLLLSQDYIIHDNFEGQHKIHSLNESTMYEVSIFQVIGNSRSRSVGTASFRIITSLRIKTNSKRKGKPAKPDFEFIPNEIIPTCGEIKWYPCGRERNCHNQESGTHFGMIIEMPYNMVKRNESQVNKEEFYTDYVSIRIKPGEIYEVVVYSINDKEITYSDIREIFVKPKFSQVRYVKVVSLPDLSILLSWEPPKYGLHTPHTISYYVDCFNVSNSEGDQILLPKDFASVYAFLNGRTVTVTQKRIFSLQPEVTYNCIIFPCVSDGVGYEYRMEYKLKIYNDKLQIAKPDFNYNFDLYGTGCTFYFQWLPCGQSFDCKNTRPGSNYTFQINPRPTFQLSFENVDHAGEFDMNVEYYVTVKSSIANTFSEPSATKLFKDCVEIRRNIS